MAFDLNIWDPQFSQNELGRITNLSTPTTNNWISAGALRVADVGSRRLRKPRLFSVAAIYEAKLTSILVEKLDAAPRACAAIARKTTEEDSWMYSVSRNFGRAKSRDYHQIVFWSDTCRGWDSTLAIPANDVLRIDLAAIAKERGEPRFPERPIFVLPVSRYLTSVLAACQLMIADSKGKLK
jgi:hypothetical protein